MFVKRMTVTVAAIGLAVSVALPSSADEAAEAGTQFAGAVAATTETLSAAATLSVSEHVQGQCSYVGVTTTDGRIVFVFGGSVQAYSRSASQPQAVQVNCRFVSENQPGVPGSEPTYQQIASTALAGAVVATGARTESLQLRPVSICVSGFGVYGPIVPDENPKFLAESCTQHAVNTPEPPPAPTLPPIPPLP